MWIRFVCALCVMCMGLCSLASNGVTRSFLEYEGGDAKLFIRSSGISNEGDVTTVGLTVECSDLPFGIDSVKISVCDSVYSSLKPFVLAGTEKDVMHKRAVWNVNVEFPQLHDFSDEDLVYVYTSEGLFELFLTQGGELKSEIEVLREKFESMTAEYEKSLARMRIWVVLAVVVMMGVVAAGCIMVARTKRRCADEMSVLNRMHIIDQENASAKDQRIADVYRRGFSTLNELCNVYFDKCDSDRTKATLVSDMENIITAYRSQKMIEELTDAINANMGDVLVHVREELPDLSNSDILFMTYLYAGFSARAVCVMMDLKLKNFYNRRSRLKDKILASDAENKEWFAEKM